jgi:inosine-uridine nucleoside N-ribohydrolase
VEGLFPDSTPAQPSDVLGAVARVATRVEGTLRWVGMGPMSNLAAVLRAQPELSGRLHVTQMGGALRYRDPERAEHNVRLDVAAAAAVLDRARDPRLVTSDVTFTPEMEIGAASPLYRQLAGPWHDQRWASLLRAHLDRWFERSHPGTMQHDALALSAAMELPFVHFSLTRVAFDEIGRLREDPGGRQVFLSRRADYPAFMRWLAAQLDPVRDATSPERASTERGSDQAPG